MLDVQGTLATARDADYWDFAARIGQDVDLEESAPEIRARFFNTIVHFVPPHEDEPHWMVAEQALESDDPDEVQIIGSVTTAQVIDTVPGSLETWVLAATIRIADYFLAADEWGLDDERRVLATWRHGLRLQAEWEQAEAHSRRWQERFAGQYGDIVIYELRDDTPIVYELAEYRDKPALLMGHPDQPLNVILVPPDRAQPWRRSSLGRVEDFGRRIAVRDAIEYAGAEYPEWVIEQTALALGETVAAIRAVEDEALLGRDPQALAELTRLADHARPLSEGLQAPLA